MLQQRAEIYNLVKELAAKFHFADFGCAKAEEVSAAVQSAYLYAQKEGHFASMHYLNNNIGKRFNPQLLVEGAQSVLVFLVPYSLPDNLTPPAGISQYALGKDYHTVIKGKLFQIMEFLANKCHNFQGRAFTDSAPVMEREWAVRAGLGFIGKNNFLVSKSCGVKNFIGVIICNAPIPATLEMEPQKKLETCGECGDCQRCLQACPTGALCTPHNIDARKCISYHTIENRNLEGSLANGEVTDLFGQIFGCDKCSSACPWNSRNLPGWEEFRSHYEELSGRKDEWWENLSEGEFKNTFKDSPLLRGGLKNILTALKWGKKIERE